MDDLNTALEDIKMLIGLGKLDGVSVYKMQVMGSICDYLQSQVALRVLAGDNISIEPHYMTLFPHMDSLQSCVDMVASQLPLNNKNAVVGALMTYHNTLIKQLEK